MKDFIVQRQRDVNRVMTPGTRASAAFISTVTFSVVPISYAESGVDVAV